MMLMVEKGIRGGIRHSIISKSQQQVHEWLW